MSIGRFKRIQLLKLVPSQNANGTNTSSKTRYTYWAEVVRGSGFRNYQNSQTQLGDSYTFKIRYNSTIDPNANYVIVYDGKQFTPTSIERDNDKNFYWNIRATAKHG